MNLRQILARKGSDVFTISPDATLADVVDSLVEHNCGSLVVVERGEIVGIITERDLLRANHARRGLMSDLIVRDHMTQRLVSATPDDEVPSVMGLLTERRVRHLPILENGRLVGLISIGDVVKAQFDALELENHYLKTYIQS